MADIGVTCSMSPSGNVWDNAAMEGFVSSLKTERVRQKVYCIRDAARAYNERFYNTTRRHSTTGYLGPVEFERRDPRLRPVPAYYAISALWHLVS
jgi:putative transposase